MTDAYDPDRDDAQPSNATPLEISIAQTTGRLDDLDMDLPRRVASPDIAEVPEPFLAHRAWGRSVDVYDPAWPVEVRRDVIAVAPEVHLHKGELYAVRKALAALRVDAEVTQWWQTAPKGRPYTFEVRAFARARLYDGPLLDARLIRVIYATVLGTKPLTRAFDLTIGVGYGGAAGAAAGAGAKTVSRRAVRPQLDVVSAGVLGLAPAALAKTVGRYALQPSLDLRGADRLGLATGSLARAVSRQAMRPRLGVRASGSLGAASVTLGRTVVRAALMMRP